MACCLSRTVLTLALTVLALGALACSPSDHTDDPVEPNDDDTSPPDDDADDDVDDDTGPEQPLRITFFDVGLGDSILVESPGGARALVDGGAIGEGTYVVCPFLAAEGIDRLDVMVATHPHYDHVGGLPEVLSCVEVNEVWTNGETLDDEADILFEEALDDWGGPVHTLAQGEVLALDAQTSVQVQNSGGGYDGLDVGPVNNDSLVLMVGAIGGRVLLTADVEVEEQDDLVADWGADLNCDLVKIPSHGKAPFSQAFIDAEAAPIAVLSVGPNGIGLPSSETVAAYVASGAAVYRTDEDGTVRCTWDGAGFEVETGR